ncbi:MAG: DUF3095 domain-containing protein [Balneolaceae bacterium]
MFNSQDSYDFYDRVPIIHNFSDVVDNKLYQPLPDDWNLVITDIRGSTKAIKKGQYKQVNMAGASVITAICNAYKDINIPFAFGGDGSTMAIPNLDTEKINGLLKFCKTAVKNAYGLNLAVGCVPMRQIREAGHDISLAKYSLSNLIHQAIFWGDGLVYAEELIKSPEWKIDNYSTIEADFSGLECRWNSFPSKKDEIVALIIKAIPNSEEEKSELYEQCIKHIEDVYGTAKEYTPVLEDQLKLTAKPKNINVELSLRTHPSTFWKKIKYALNIIYMQVAGWILMKFDIETKYTKWGDYKKDFVQHADFRKFSDALRLVVSGTVKQRMELQSRLEVLYKKEKIAFGLCPSSGAITTCYVTNYQGYHVHFIDGSDGGYAKASQDLKKRLKKIS